MGSWSFGYDPLNRLIAGSTNTAIANGNLDYCWNYDQFGNRLQQSGSSQAFVTGSPTCQAAPSPATLTTNLAAYNILNQMLSTNAGGTYVQPVYDASGDMTSDGTNVYVYDAEGRVCAVQSLVGGGMTGYLYDAAGNRVAKGTIRPVMVNGQATLSCDHAANGFALTAQYLPGPSGEQMTELNSTGAWVHTNVTANGSLFATFENDNKGAHFYLTDWLGTRRAQTNYLGAVENTWTSLPYGDALTPSANLDPTEQHFTGKERDAESGLDYFGARYYGSNMGRFMSPDPSKLSVLLTNPQTWNRYSYVYNNPLSLKDENGKWPTSIHNQIIDKAFPNLSPAQRQILKNVSANQDGIMNGGQSKDLSFEHAMRAPGQSVADAQAKYSDFVSTEEAAANNLQIYLSDPDEEMTQINPESLAAFGEALHAIEDSLSPAHAGFQVWDYNPAHVLHHHNAENSINGQQMQNAVNAARNAFNSTYSFFGFTAGSNDNATVTTSQHDNGPCGGSTGTPCNK